MYRIFYIKFKNRRISVRAVRERTGENTFRKRNKKWNGKDKGFLGIKWGKYT